MTVLKRFQKSALPEPAKRGRPVLHQMWNDLVKRVTDLEGGLPGPTQVPAVRGRKNDNFRRFHVVSIAKDWLVCRAWDGSQLGEDEVLVAKPPLLRGSVTSYGSASYSGYNATYTERTSTIAGEDNETQVVVPAYLLDTDTGTANAKDIYAMKNPLGGTGVFIDDEETQELDWMELPGPRAWAKKSE